MNLDTMEAIRTRRVAKWYADNPIPDKLLWQVLEAARWAPSASNRRVHRFVCITERELLRQIKMFSPGMVAGLPAALIVICVDWNLAAYDSLLKRYRHVYFDVGHASQNMLLAAHALGLVAGPMSSFSKDAVRVLLDLPEMVEPLFFVGLGYPTELPPEAPRWPTIKTRVEDLVQWGPYPANDESD